MAVKIRLLRMGKIRNPQYRIVVADSRTKRDGRAIEFVGIYQPKEDPSVIQVKSDRVQYWLSVGAQPSEAVQRHPGEDRRLAAVQGPAGPAAAAGGAEAPTDRLAVYEAEAKAAAGVADAPAAKPAKKAAKAAPAEAPRRGCRRPAPAEEPAKTEEQAGAGAGEQA